MRTFAATLSCLLLAGLFSGLRPLSAAEAPSRAADEKEIMATLETYAQAIIHNDVPTLDRIYHEDLSYSHSTGQTQNKAEIMRAVPNGTFTVMKFSDTRFQFYGDVAVVRTITDLTYRPGDRHLNQLFVMLKGAKGWQIVTKHTTRIEPAPAPPRDRRDR